MWSLKYAEQARTLGNHHQQPAAAGMVLRMTLEVLGQIVDPGRQEGNLHLGRSRIGLPRLNDPMISVFFSFVIAIARPKTAGFVN